MNDFLRQARRQPFSIGFAIALLAVSLVVAPGRGRSVAVVELFGNGFESVVDHGHWWGPVTSVFLSTNAGELVLAIAAAVLVLGYAERLMGTRRTVIAFLVTAVVASAIGLTLQGIGIANGELWARGVSELFTVDPFTPIAGAVMAASCFAGPLWRRRIRVLVLSTVAVLLLYSGQPSDLYRLLAAVLGLGLGRLFRPGTIAGSWRRSSHHEARSLLAAIVGVAAVGPVVTIFSGGRFGILAPLGLLLTQDVPDAGAVVDRCTFGNVTRACLHDLTLERVGGVGPVLVSLLPLLALLVAAWGMARGRRFGAWLAIIMNVGFTALGAWYYGLVPIVGRPYIVNGRANHYWEVAFTLAVSTLVPLIIAGVVFLNLRRFTVHTTGAVLRRFAVASVLSFVALSAIYVSLGWLLRDGFRPRPTLMDLIADVPERFIPIGFLRLERLSFLPTDWISSTLYQWVGPLFWIIVTFGAFVCMRTVPFGSHANDRADLRRLLATGGGGSLSYMATWEGNSLWFNADRTVVVAYRLVNNVAITTTEPIGPREQVSAAIGDFSTMCDDHGWIPVFYSYHAALQPVFTGMGWQSMRVAEETILRPQKWDTTGKKWQDIRSSINRADRAGVRAEWTSYRELSTSATQQIVEISEQWVQEKELPELGFTLGGLDELKDPSVRLMLAVDADGSVQAVTSWLPSYRAGTIVGWTLDFMRRRPDSMNGVMEFVIAQTAKLMADQAEIEFLSLSAAPLASAPGIPAAPPSLTVRLLDFMGRTLEPVYGFRSLLAFKQKFQPEFEPMYMAYPDAVALPTIGLSLARAYLPTLSVREAVLFARGLGSPQQRGAKPDRRALTAATKAAKTGAKAAAKAVANTADGAADAAQAGAARAGAALADTPEKAPIGS